MYITNVTEYYNNFTDDFNETISINTNFTINGNTIDIITPAIILSLPCGFLFVCGLSLMLPMIFKPLKTNK